MNPTVGELIELVKSRQSHVLLLDGNIYDTVSISPAQEFGDAAEMLLALTAKTHPSALRYDLFFGTRILRGDAKKITKAMGIASGEKSDDPNAELVAALKKAKMVNSSPLPVNPQEAFSAFADLLAKSETPTLLIAEYADAIVPPAMGNISRANERALMVALTSWSRSRAIREAGHLIVLLARAASDLDGALMDRAFEIARLRFPKPGEEERERFISSAVSKRGLASALGRASAGLSFKEIKKLLPAIKSADSLEPALDAVFAAKKKVLSDEYGDVLAVMQPKLGFEAIGGLEQIVQKLMKVAASMREGKRTLVPQGILFMGPPGTGKTVLAEALAKAAGLNFVKPLDIKSMWVGESERRMSRFLDALRDLAPVAVFIDEFDQSQGTRGGFDGDSGVSRGLFKKMLEVMSDTTLRGKILWILATNRPDLIDSAMKRPGRCDLRLPFLPPGKEDLAKICVAAFRQFPEMATNIKNWQPYAERSEGYSGADMIEVIRRAWERANELGEGKIGREHMEWALSDYRPQTLEAKEIAKMALLSIIECSSNSLLPKNVEDLTADYIEKLTGERPTVVGSRELGEALSDPALRGKLN